MATQYEDRWINGDKYTVPVGTREDWRPGQPYNLPSAQPAAGGSGGNLGTRSNLPGNPSGTFTSAGTFLPGIAYATESPRQTAAQPAYQDILQGYFKGDPAAYAAEILRKQQAGIPLSNPAEAQAFMQAYPQYFQGAFQPTYSGSPNVPRNSPLIGGSSAQYSFPYEQTLRDLFAQSTYTPPSDADLLQQAQQYARLQVDPVLSAIQSRLEKAQSDYESQKAAIEAAYATVPQTTQRLLDEARQNALEQAVARGMGRSGVVEWLTNKLTAPLMEQATQSEQEKAAKLAAAANALAQIQQEAARQQQEAQQREGELEASQLAQLRDQIAQRVFQERAAKWSQATGLAGMAQAANLGQQQQLMNLIDKLLYG